MWLKKFDRKKYWWISANTSKMEITKLMPMKPRLLEDDLPGARAANIGIEVSRKVSLSERLWKPLDSSLNIQYISYCSNALILLISCTEGISTFSIVFSGVCLRSGNGKDFNCSCLEVFARCVFCTPVQRTARIQWKKVNGWYKRSLFINIEELKQRPSQSQQSSCIRLCCLFRIHFPGIRGWTRHLAQSSSFYPPLVCLQVLTGRRPMYLGS